MYEQQPTTGAACDHTHPFPAPAGHEWIDSMEFGDPTRLEVPGAMGTYDRDSTEIRRALGAWLWGTDCLEQHIATIAADPIVTAYVLTVAELTLRDRAHFEFEQALKAGGLEAGREVCEQMEPEERVNQIGFALGRILHGFTMLRSDLVGQLRTL